jgi:hypothetical protein
MKEEYRHQYRKKGKFQMKAKEGEPDLKEKA